MCGIAGHVGLGGSAAAIRATRRALAALAHRGPDDGGLLADWPAEGLAASWDREGRALSTAMAPALEGGRGGAVLGCHRLAILDRSPAGHQPMVSPDGRFAIVHNGEVVNHVELRAELEALGHRFRSRSDTEVLLAAFAAWGPACFPRLVGMFACAILDTRTRRCILARDGFGIKPLFYHAAGGRLVFASEIPALLTDSAIDRRIDPQRLLDYLDEGITDHGGGTLLADIRALPAAHYAEISLDDPERVRAVRYWHPDRRARLDLGFDQAAARLRELLVESVRLHLRSDVPVGALVSGGLDSSTLLLLMREIGGSALDLHTFGYVAGAGAASEEPWMDLANGAAGAVPHKVRLAPDAWREDLDELLLRQGEPCRTIAVLAPFRLFREAAAAGIRVALDGHGADELMGGYGYFRSARLASLLRRGALGAAARDLVRLTRDGGPGLRLAAQGIGRALPGRLAGWLEDASRARRRPWIDWAWARREGVAPRRAWPVPGPWSLREAQWLAVRERSLPTVLRYEDRNAMAHGVESRVPFLTPALAEFTLACPEEYWIDARGTRKALLRAAVRGLIPEAIRLRREKIAFAVPIQRWLPSGSGLADLLRPAARMPGVDPAFVHRLVASLRHASAPAVADAAVAWRLGMLAAWARRLDARAAG